MLVCIAAVQNSDEQRTANSEMQNALQLSRYPPPPCTPTGEAFSLTGYIQPTLDLAELKVQKVSYARPAAFLTEVFSLPKVNIDIRFHKQVS